MTEIRRPRVLGVFAHPDDETFCAGGTLAHYTERGAEAMVISATRGQAGQIRDAAQATRRTLAQVREQELRAACAVLGVEHVECWDYTDGTLEDQEERLRADVLELIERFRPDVVITFGDDGAYGHPDHVAISRVTTDGFLDAVTRLDLTSVRLYHSHFPRSRLLMGERLSTWLVEMNARFKGTGDFAQALSLFAQESTTMGYANDFVDVSWFPPRFTIVEQGEPASCLYLILSGEVDVVQEQDDGTVHELRRLAPGEFFGELGVAYGTERSASVIAVDAVTCLVLSPSAPTPFAGRGGGARFTGVPLDTTGGSVGATATATAVMDVSRQVDRKVAAIAAHRTQFPIEPGMFPASMLQEMFGTEYFVRVHPPSEPERGLLPETFGLPEGETGVQGTAILRLGGWKPPSHGQSATGLGPHSRTGGSMKFIVDVTLEKLDYDEDPAEVAERLKAILVNSEVHGVESINGVEVSSEAGEQQPHEKGSGVNPQG